LLTIRRIATYAGPVIAPTLDAVEELVTCGYVRLSIGHGDGDPLPSVLAAARRFFAQSASSKARHASDDRNHGYRAMGHEYSATPDRLDLNECFTMWSERLDLIPNAIEITDYTSALLTYRATMIPIVTEIVAQLGERFGAADLPRFAAASHLQMNSYNDTAGDRDLLQDRHEDAHLLTVLHATADGLEVFVNDEPTPICLEPGELIVFAGSVLTALTGGAIAPLYHQVRNLHLADRVSVMYFVNPQLDRPLYPWVASATEEPVDLREQVRQAPAAYGLAAVPML
jgi:isopenicillin N synthase-like dioxygenase